MNNITIGLNSAMLVNIQRYLHGIQDRKELKSKHKTSSTASMKFVNVKNLVIKNPVIKIPR